MLLTNIRGISSNGNFFKYISQVVNKKKCFFIYHHLTLFTETLINNWFIHQRAFIQI